MTYKSYKTYKNLFLQSTPLLDVRSESEFVQGSFPLATNIPILNDSERHQVGLCYAQKGSTAALALGHQLVCGETKRQRVDTWKEFAQKNLTGALFCWRGGERSRLAQEWLLEAGVNFPRIEGGFKALRRFLMETMEDIISKTEWIVIAGPTGSGKTERIQKMENAIDLEACANHRGSAFGGNPSPQPSQIDFEHCLAIELLKRHEKGITKIYAEDESRMVGKSALPISLYQKILTSPLIVIDEPMEKRVERVLRDYVTPAPEKMLPALERIAKRLGGALYKNIRQDLAQALCLEEPEQSAIYHRVWIEKILTEYYDPMYDHSLKERSGRILRLSS